MTAGTPSRNDGPSRHSARSGHWILAIGAVVVLAGSAWLLKIATSSRVVDPVVISAAGEPIKSVGEYRSPDGRTLLILMETVDAKGVIVEAKYQAEPPASARWQIDATQPWYFMFGEDSKLWGYASDQGPHSWHATSEGSAMTTPGIHGGWSGVPESYLKLLPQEHRDVHAQWLANQNVARQP
jgi:hypothetical protein